MICHIIFIVILKDKTIHELVALHWNPKELQKCKLKYFTEHCLIFGSYPINISTYKNKYHFLKYNVL